MQDSHTPLLQGLLAAAAGGISPQALDRADWGAVPQALPTIVLSLVFHNVVPVICSQLEVRACPRQLRELCIHVVY